VSKRKRTSKIEKKFLGDICDKIRKKEDEI
jgi:hypothetical protein